MGDYELYHARSHKYIKKIGNRYFYSQDEIRAYYSSQADIAAGQSEVRSIGKDAAKKAVEQAAQKQDEIVKDKKERRKKKGASIANKHLKKPLSSLKSSISKGKKALSRAMPRIGHETTIKSGGVETTTVTYNDGSATSKKTSKSKSRVGHNTTINSGGHVTSADSKKRRMNSGHNTKIKTRQIK